MAVLGADPEYPDRGQENRRLEGAAEQFDGQVPIGIARLVRDGTVAWQGEIATLRRFNEDAREVLAGFDCGIVLKDFADVKEGDVIEAYTTRQVERELA